MMEKEINILYENHHEPIVSRETFEAVQRELEKRKKPNRNTKVNDTRFPAGFNVGNAEGIFTDSFAKGLLDGGVRIT